MKSNKYMGYIFEVAWILPSVAIPIAILVAIAITTFAVGLVVPGINGRVDPKALTSDVTFAEPGVKELAPGVYEATVIAQAFLFTPREIEVPAGSKVTFIVTSQDVIHGFKITGTDVNMMVVPGQISKATTVFNTPGEYLLVCHEFCGSGHHAMYGTIIVTEK